MKKMSKEEKVARQRANKVEARMGVDPLVVPKIHTEQPIKVATAYAKAHEAKRKTAHSLPIDSLNRAINAVKPANVADARNLKGAAIELSRLRADLSLKHNFGLKAASLVPDSKKAEAMAIARRVSHERNIASLRKFRIKWAPLFAQYGI